MALEGIQGIVPEVLMSSTRTAQLEGGSHNYTEGISLYTL